MLQNVVSENNVLNLIAVVAMSEIWFYTTTFWDFTNFFVNNRQQLVTSKPPSASNLQDNWELKFRKLKS